VVPALSLAACPHPGSIIAAAVMSWVLQLQVPDVPEKSTGWLIFGGSTRRAMFWTGAGCQLWASGGPYLALYLDYRRRRNYDTAAAGELERQLTIIMGVLSPLVGIAAKLAEVKPIDPLPASGSKSSAMGPGLSSPGWSPTSEEQLARCE
jgi:hypothetical protein